MEQKQQVPQKFPSMTGVNNELYIHNMLEQGEQGGDAVNQEDF